MDFLKKLIVGILGLFGLSTILSAKKSKEVAKQVEKLQENKTKNKKEITNLKRKLTRTKNEVKKMEVTFEKDDVDDAAAFLRKFSKSK